ncbi:MAG: ATP-binding protein [Campylobacterota bacterium]
MEYVIDFVKNDEVDKSKIFKDLNCTVEQAQILQYLTLKYIGGNEDVVVLDMLQAMYDKEYEYLKKIEVVKSLIDLGWLVKANFLQVKAEEATNLELLNANISLSTAFFRLLEEGSLETAMPEVKAYTDHLEYLQDQFYRVELLVQLTNLRANYSEDSPNINRLKNKLSLLKKRIGDRLAQSEEKIIVEEFFAKNKLDEKEQVIFLALLREEYAGSEGNLREMNSLIEIVSYDEYERIKNRALLEDGAKLLEQGLINYDEILNPFGGISRSFYIDDETLHEIMHPQKKKKVGKLKLNSLVESQEMFEYIEPKTTIDDVVLNAQTRKTLETILKQMDKDVHRKLKEWGIKEKKTVDARIIFYGAPGTGKTMTAYSLAKSMRRPVLSFDCSKILGQYVGESEKNVRAIFDNFYDLSKKSKSDPVLLLNEADQFLSARGGVGHSTDKMYNQMQNIFLEQIEKFEGVLIATTNLLQNLDKAFSRRFNYKLEFKKPGLKQRVQLWQLMLPENADYEDGFAIDTLASYNLTGGQINMIIKNTAYSVAIKDESVFKMEDFRSEIKKELGSEFENEAAMGFGVD